MEAIKVSTDRWREKQNVVYAHNRIAFGLKKEGDSEYITTDKTGGHYTTWNKPFTTWQILNDWTYMRYLE